MVGVAILDTVFVRPVKEDDITWGRGASTVQPLAFGLEPVHSVSADCKLRDYAFVDVATLVGAPAYKASTPLYPAAETVPAPVWFAAHIAKLRLGNLHQLVVSVIHNRRKILGVEFCAEHGIYLGYQFLVWDVRM